jgi:hypothetical protein
VSIVGSETVTIAFFVVTGWAALWPFRGRLGAWSYHLAALPVGLLASPLAGGVSTLSGRPLDAASAVAGALLLVVAFKSICLIVYGRKQVEPARPGLRSFAIAGGALGGLTLVLALARISIWNNDSFMSYWPLGVELSRKGAFTATMISSRSPLLPTMNAIHATFGSDWAYVIYPMLAATLLAWMALSLWTGPLAGLGTKTKTLLVGGVVGFLVIEPSFLFHSFMVHSHMVSAVYLLMSLTCLWAAVPRGEARDGDEPRYAYLVLAGAFAAGLALARPDGLAYQFVPVAVAISVLTATKVSWRAVLAFFAPMLLLVGGSYATAYITLGMWKAAKLSGGASLAILAVLALAAAGPWIVQALDRRLPFRVSGERFLGLITVVAAVGMAGALAIKWQTAQLALATARINLFEGAGGYSYLWYAVVIVLALSLATRDALRRGSWTRSPFLAIALFFIVAAVVHGTSHEGRIGAGDSLNRVAFHVLPVVVWYAGAVVARIVRGSQPRSSARIQSHSD